MAERYPITVRTYAELRRWVEDFKVNPKCHCLCVFGSPGLGKSETIRASLGEWKGTEFIEGAVLIKGKLTAFKLFERIADAQDQLIQFDDTRGILKNHECVSLLMQLTEQKKVKVVQYNSKAAEATEVRTTSRAILAINRIDEDNPDLDPFFSRAICLEFRPTKAETHTYAGEWFLDSGSGGPGSSNMARRMDVYDTMGRMLRDCPVMDCRDYGKALAAYNTKKPRDFFAETWSENKYAAAALAIKNHTPKLKQKDAVAAFEKMCGGSKAQLYRELRLLQDDECQQGGQTIDLKTALSLIEK